MPPPNPPACPHPPADGMVLVCCKVCGAFKVERESPLVHDLAYAVAYLAWMDSWKLLSLAPSVTCFYDDGKTGCAYVTPTHAHELAYKADPDSKHAFCGDES